MQHGSQSKHANLGGLQRGTTRCSFTLKRVQKIHTNMVKTSRSWGGIRRGLGRVEVPGFGRKGVPEGCSWLLSLVP